MRFFLSSYQFCWAAIPLMMAIGFLSCGKRTCSPGSYIYEDQRVYQCFAEHAPSTATKRQLIFECKKENFYPVIVTQVVKHSSNSQSIFETFTCLDSEGNIELILHPHGASLYCAPERAGEWKEVFHEGIFSRHVYYRCPGEKDNDQFFFDNDVIQIESQGTYYGDNLLACPAGQEIILSSTTEVGCG